MTLLSGENILKQYNDYKIFEELSFSIVENDRIGLVGPNGIGKTTLFEIMTGSISPDLGQINKPKSSIIGYVEQEIIGHDNTILLDFMATAREDLLKLKADIDRIALELEKDPGSQKTIEKLGNYQHRFENEGGYDFESEIKIILAGLGFPKDRFHSRLSSFSGGEKNRASLARLLAGRSNLLLLDEPTNHLDIESTIWLEEYLKSQNKAYIIVSHDRTFLSNTINKVWEITSKKIDQYYNGFDKFLVEREERRRLKRHIFKHQQDEIRQIEYFIRKNMAGQKTKQAQSKQKFLDRIEKVDLPESEQIGPSFKVDSGQRSHNLVLALEDASFGYGHHALISDVNLNIYRGDRVGLIGVNGSGKTTILKTILNQIEPISGKVQVGNKVDVAYFDQELSELNDNNTILDELWQVDRLADAGRLRSFLAR
ncbi:MAG: ABC-F family ATP-binding cassette domain-containing protein, partial [candidate division Zixibacteria bacterium]|nr:ABC-F family ATP-binding cassette domain-containing protein [candidate division Zixibacteria bacterium]